MFAAWDWNAVYLTCFGVGLVLSVAAFLGGFGHLHIGHFKIGHLHSVKAHAGPHAVGPLNGFSIVAFLCWFGGTGYLLHRFGPMRSGIVLLLASASGVAAGAFVFWFLAKVLMPMERTLEPEDTELTGMLGRLSASVTAHGFGEMLYSQNGSRRSVVVRSVDGRAIEKGAEAVVMRVERGVAYVRRWDEFESGLLGAESVQKR